MHDRTDDDEDKWLDLRIEVATLEIELLELDTAYKQPKETETGMITPDLKSIQNLQSNILKSREKLEDLFNEYTRRNIATTEVKDMITHLNDIMDQAKILQKELEEVVDIDKDANVTMNADNNTSGLSNSGRTWSKGESTAINSLFEEISVTIDTDKINRKLNTSGPPIGTSGARKNQQTENAYPGNKTPANDELCQVLVFFKNLRAANLTAISQTKSENEAAAPPGKYRYTRKQDRNGIIIFEAEQILDSDKNDTSTKALQKFVSKLLKPENLQKCEVTVDENNQIIYTLKNKKYNLTELLKHGDINKLTFPNEECRSYIDFALLKNQHPIYKASLGNEDPWKGMCIVKADTIENGKEYFKKNDVDSNRYILIKNKLYFYDPNSPISAKKITLNNEIIDSLNKKFKGDPPICKFEKKMDVVKLFDSLEINNEIVNSWKMKLLQLCNEYKSEHHLETYKIENAGLAEQIAANIYTSNIYAAVNMLITGENERLWEHSSPTNNTGINQLITQLRSDPKLITLILLTSSFAIKGINDASEVLSTTMRKEVLPGYIVNQMSEGFEIQRGITSTTYSKSSYIEKENLKEDASTASHNAKKVSEFRKEITQLLSSNIDMLNKLIKESTDKTRINQLGQLLFDLNNINQDAEKPMIGKSFSEQMQILNKIKSLTDNAIDSLPKSSTVETSVITNQQSFVSADHTKSTAQIRFQLAGMRNQNNNGQTQISTKQDKVRDAGNIPTGAALQEELIETGHTNVPGGHTPEEMKALNRATSDIFPSAPSKQPLKKQIKVELTPSNHRK